MSSDHKKLHVVFVVYDGITNSVFQSQVVQPLLKRIADGSYAHVTLISFEKHKPDPTVLQKLIPAHDSFHFALGRKLPFWGLSSLSFAVHQLKKLLTLIPCDKIIARGPFAGFVAAQALKKNQLLVDSGVRVLVQARGLCAEEFRYAWKYQSKKNMLEKFIYAIKYRAFKRLEKRVFSTKKTSLFEAVSPALKTYLAQEFGASNELMSIAHYDIPEAIDHEQITKWRDKVRNELGIADDALVYCYSGSHKPWQCAAETIEYFADKHKKDSKSFLLILSQDAQTFSDELERSGVPASAYKVMSVKPSDLLHYLAAGDFGMLFRKKDLVNWVSRPTKMLEYQAVGLKVVHNNTIAWLVD